jgi:AcrR family transcriptional regulator
MAVKDAKRHDILKAAMDLFARNGFRGTTTRDLASHADVNEAIIFRHFHSKNDLYRAILEEKLSEIRDARWTGCQQPSEETDPRTFLEAFGRHFLERHVQDTTFMRLLLFSALEGHELSEMFIGSIAGKDPLASYLQSLMDNGTFRRMDPNLAARAFLGMFVSFLQMQEIFGQKKVWDFDRAEVVETFVSIFLSGMKP